MDNKDKFVNETAKTVFSELSQEDKKFLLDNPEPYEHHFGLGLYIRNEYIHGKNLGFWAMMPDDLSAEVVSKIIELCKGEAKS